MKRLILIAFLIIAGAVFFQSEMTAQPGIGPGAYCMPLVTSVPCNQTGPSNSPGNGINDFIDFFSTSGANTNITNLSSGCNTQNFPGIGPRNYFNHSCTNFMVASPGQVITATLQSGITFAQGFAIFIDWNQDNIFQTPGELVAWTTAVPAAATPTILTFSIPPGQANGAYRMRVRCSFVAAGNAIDPCTNQTFGEVEDYAIYIGSSPSVSITGVSSNSSPVCENGTFSLNIVSTATAPTTYTWSGPAGYTNTSVQNPVITNALPNMGGVYSVTVANGACPLVASTQITVIPFPVVTVAPLSSTVCQGGSYLASLTSANPSLYTYQWSGSATFVSPNVPTTLINTQLLPASIITAVMVYSVVITPTILNCPTTLTLDVLINNPPTPTITMPPAMCNTSPITSAIGLPPGGTWYGNPNISAGGIINPAPTTLFGNFLASYSITVGSCTASTSGNISISKFQTAAITGNLPNQCALDRPTDLMSVVQNSLGIWSGVGVSANTFTPAGLPTNTYVLFYYNPSTPFANVCPATNTLLVSVFNPQTPFIQPILPSCTNSGSVALLATPPNGVWSGNSGVAPWGIFTPGLSNTTIGVNTVTYTAGQGTCVASSSATFHVSRFNSAALTVSALNLCVTTNSIELMNLVTNTVLGVWTATGTPSGLTGGSGLAYFFNPAGLPTGNYPLVYNTTSFPNPLQCPDSRTLSISLLNPIQPTIGLAGPFCNADSPFQLSVSPPTGSFVNSPYVSPSGLFYPSSSNVGNNTVQYIIGTSTCNITDTKQISVEAFVSSTIAGLVPDLCITSQAFNLFPLTTTTLGIWSGNGVTGLLFNPALAGSGIHTLVYSTASSPSGLCPANSTLAAIVYTLAPPFMELEGPLCNSSSALKVRVTPLGGVFGIGPAVDALGVFNPAFAAIGNNIISYTVNAGPCLAYTYTTIKVEKYVSADLLSGVGPFCKFDNGADLSSIVQNPGGTWGGPGLTGNYFTPVNANIGNSNILRYITQSETFDLCPDTSDVRVLVQDVPEVKISRDLLTGCAPVKVTFNNSGANTGKGEWTLGDGSVPLEGLSVVHTYTAPGTYSVVFNYRSDIGCKNQGVLYNAVTVFESPRAGFSYSPYQEVSISNPEVQFINQTLDVGKTTYQWKIDNLYSTADVNPIVIFPAKGEYKITLKATNIQNCSSEFIDIVVVKPDFDVFVPNSFSPNFDGLNDVFLPVFSQYGLDTKTFELEIFDRWGQSIFRTKDINRGWDGSLQNKGEALKEEIYVYKLKYKDLEGKIYNKQGYVTMIK